MSNKKIKRDNSLSVQHIMVIDILHTANWLEEKISGIIKSNDITHHQYNILKNVYSASPEPMSVLEIKETIMFKNSDVTGLLDRLVNKGLLDRKTCPQNRRKIDITISNEGKKLVESIQPELNDAFNGKYVDNISKEESIKISEILRKIRRNK